MKRSIVTLIAIAVSCLILSTTSTATFPEDEAGICAYINAGKTINLALVTGLYRTIETQTAEYIIGSMEIAGTRGTYPETEDVHVYVNVNGWVVAYYLAGEPTSKIIDWLSYDGGVITTTKLELALGKVAAAAGFALVGVKYYHFVTPQANRLLMVIDMEDGDGVTDTFQIMIPFEFTVWEKSWGLYAKYSTAKLYIDGSLIQSLGPSTSWLIDYGKLDPTQLPQGSYRTVSVYNADYAGASSGKWSSGGVVLVYQQP